MPGRLHAAAASPLPVHMMAACACGDGGKHAAMRHGATLDSSLETAVPGGSCRAAVPGGGSALGMARRHLVCLIAASRFACDGGPERVQRRALVGCHKVKAAPSQTRVVAPVDPSRWPLRSPRVCLLH